MVLVSFQPFVDSVFDSFRNDGEIAVFQVEEQFFERTSDLDPRMIPAHDAVNALFVGNVFDDVAGMFQWKIHLIALHREDAAVTFGQGMNRAGEWVESAVAPKLLIMLRVGTMLSPELNSMEAWKIVS